MPSRAHGLHRTPETIPSVTHKGDLAVGGSMLFCLSVSVSRSGCVGFVSCTRLCTWCWRDLKYRTSNEETKVSPNKVLREYVTEHKPVWRQLVIRHYSENSEREVRGRDTDCFRKDRAFQFDFKRGVEAHQVRKQKGPPGVGSSRCEDLEHEAVW